jgi:hypothetical protein
MMNWHRLFGLFLMDLFTGSPYVVELEKDLSFKQQFLDVVILRKDREGNLTEELPDGLDNLADHNLLTYKSLREPFDDWTVKELVGHYVNYRKQSAPAPGKLLPESHFRLYGVSTRFPQGLAQQVNLTPQQPGVYDLAWGTDTVRLIVLCEIADHPRNALWRLFSAQRDAVAQARGQYRPHQPDMSTVVQQLFENYQLERIDMPYTMQDFQRDYVREHLDLLTPDEVLNRYSPDEILKRYSPDEVLKHYSLDERLDGLSPDELEKLFETLKQRIKSS